MLSEEQKFTPKSNQMEEEKHSDSVKCPQQIFYPLKLYYEHSKSRTLYFHTRSNRVEFMSALLTYLGFED